MNQHEIEQVILELLAEEAGQDPAELRAELEGLGVGMPIDSLLAAEVLARVEEIYGISLPTDAETARNLTSVSTFATAIHELALEHADQAGRTA